MTNDQKERITNLRQEGMCDLNDGISTCISLNSELTWWRGLNLHANLDNRMSAKSSVQKSHNTSSTKGCLVSLVFNKTPNPQVRLDIADMLLIAFEKRRRIES